MSVKTASVNKISRVRVMFRSVLASCSPCNRNLMSGDLVCDVFLRRWWDLGEVEISEIPT